MSTYRRSASPQRAGDSPGSRRPQSFIDMSPSAAGLPTLPSLPDFAPQGGYTGTGTAGLGPAGLGGFFVPNGPPPPVSPTANPNYYGAPNFYAPANSHIGNMGLQSYPSASQGLPPPPTFSPNAAFDPLPNLGRRDSLVLGGGGRRDSLSSRDSPGGGGPGARTSPTMPTFDDLTAAQFGDISRSFAAAAAASANDANIFTSQHVAPPQQPPLARQQQQQQQQSPHGSPVLDGGTPATSSRATMSPTVPSKAPPASNAAGASAKPAGQKVTRTYRKKTPPEACAVCATSSTPEWRKGPSGLRTLCNACGLTAAKQPAQDPKTVEEVWQQLTDIGVNRFRGNYTLTPERKEIARKTWIMAKETGQTPRVSNRTYPNRASNANANANPGGGSGTANAAGQATDQHPQAPPGGAGRGYRPNAGGGARNPNDLEGAQALFSMSRGRNQSFSDGDGGGRSPPSASKAAPYPPPPPGGYASAAPNPPTMPGPFGQTSPLLDGGGAGHGRPAGVVIGGAAGGRRKSQSQTGRMSISSMLNRETPSRPTSAQSNRSNSAMYQ